MEKKLSSIMICLLLLTGGILAVIPQGSGSRPSIEDTYHLARFNVNLTYKENGSPAMGYEVIIKSQSGYGMEMVGITDIDGRTCLNLTYHHWGARMLFVQDPITADKVYLDYVFIEPDGVYYRDIELEPVDQGINSVSGRVYDRDTGSPITGAEVMISGMDIYHNGFTNSTFVGPAGSYEFTFPHTSHRITLTALGGADHHYKQYYFHGLPSKHDYEIDLPLRANTDDKRSVKLRVTNDTEEHVFMEGSLRIGGQDRERDMLRVYKNDHSPDPMGWWEIMVNQGEYEMEFEGDRGPDGVKFSKFRALYVNESDISMDMRVNVPERAPLQVEVWNDTSPISNAAIRWTHTWYDDTGSSGLDCYMFTDSEGIADITVMENMTTALSIRRSGYKELNIDHHNGTTREIGRINVTLEEIPEDDIPTAEVRVEVIDEMTDVPVPAASINGHGMHGGTQVYFNGKTNETGTWTGEAPIGTDYTITTINSLGEGSTEDVEITSEGENDLQVYVDQRASTYPEKVHSFFYVKDPSGENIPGALFSVNNIGGTNYWTEAVSDENGRVDLFLYPGKCRIMINFNYLQYDNEWTIDETTAEIPEGGGALPDITLYPSLPLDMISGHVYDSSTGHPIPAVHIYSDSWRITGEPWEGAREPWDHPGAVHTQGLESMTAPDGYYRNWHRDTLFLSASRNGYFPEQIRMDPTRGDTVRDIYLDPIPEYTVEVSGTIVDHNGDPVYPADIWAWDSDREIYGQPQFWDLSEDGNFSFHTYPGNFTLQYHNDTLQGMKNITVGEDGLSGLVLELVPYSDLNGTVMNWNGTALEGINVTLQKEEDENFSACKMTGSDGRFHFRVEPGTYTLHIATNELYSSYGSKPQVINGWEDIDLDITLLNRTMGHFTAQVEGEEGPGPFSGQGIPGCSIIISNATGATIFGTVTDDVGSFTAEIPFDHGLVLSVEPPEFLSFLEGSRPGYLGTSVEFDFPFQDWTQWELEQITLQYIRIPDVEYLNITSFHPTGDDVPLDEPIYVAFSHPVNSSSFEDAFVIDPVPEAMSLLWNKDMTLVEILHDDLLPNTTYTVTIHNTVLSRSGMWLYGLEGMTWDFTTGNTTAVWRLYSSAISVDDEMDLIVSVVGLQNISVHIVIEDVGSFRLMENSPGEYTVNINGSNFEWNTTYHYHFSDTEGGEDMAPLLSSSFSTPVEPSSADDDDIDDDDDDDDDTGEKGSSYGFITAVMIIVILLLIALVVILLIRRQTSPETVLDEE
ncbi:MAG: Ig-like domain-containing protein [Thermoplasmatota archaeon]